METRPHQQQYLGRQLRKAAFSLCALFALGTVAFWGVGRPDWTLLDALFMTVITVTTVGYQEVHRLSSAGRIVSMMLILGGVGTGLYALGSIAEAVLSGQVFWRRRVLSKIRRLSNHFIVCGYGRVGQAICRELEAQGRPFVIIDLKEPPIGSDLPLIVGDATEDGMLERAGITRAKSLVTVLGSDAENIYAVLAARELCPELFIVSRCSEDRSSRKLRSAGADRVINPYDRGGMILAQVMLRPKVVDFLEQISWGAGQDIHMEEIAIGPGSELVGLRLRDSPIRSELDIILTAIMRPGGEFDFNPAPDLPLREGDLMIAMGRPEALDALTRRAANTRSSK